ncbi:hypothetical protein [Pleomorphomonas carboxyditropha]|uniref:Uncharacterized protein n=1 Tax=Pleomorphomonas carboxyditropha TaxID=2023338 RepID=A0A2G9WN71_9HYPH|nr:hypothetical protein [Pleomorphomonas carboxyditropha]PIO96157.1 hypothetical protein CJ014_26900 [Pleomorphomonas carboxyditropha]
MPISPALPAQPQLRPKTLSLPPSLAELERTLRPEEAASRTPTLSRALTEDERSILSRLVDEVAPLAEAKPDSMIALQEAAKLLTVFPAGNISEAVLDARSKAYDIALEDVPAWAVEAAARRWIKGEVATLGDKPNLSFPPSPPQLRALALDEWAKARAVLWRYRRLMEGKTERVVPLEKRRPLPKEMLQALNG